MSSGTKQLVVNPLERILSTDFMRAQSFDNAATQEMLRALFDTNLGADDTQAAGFYLANLSQTNPLTAEIIGGFLFTPQIGSSASGVGPGVACVFDPDVILNTDDSPYKMIQDPGTTSVLNPSLVLTPNSSGQPRIDVIECQRVQPDNVVETDSRDVFNTITGLFTGVTVNKVTIAQFNYRIRVGAPGSGFPGTAQGWLPLAVAYVPNTTTWDACTIWDVRPLLSDRIFNVQNIAIDLPRKTTLEYSTNNATGLITRGVVEVDGGNRRLGGRLQRGSPGTDGGYVDFMDAANQDPTINIAGGPGLVFFYLVTPFGLPRWARYTDVSAGIRYPRSPRGIPIVSQIPPSHVYDIATAPITFGTAFGFAGASTQAAVCFGAAFYASGAIFNQTTSDGWTEANNLLAPTVGSVAATVTDPVLIKGTFTFTENVHFPAGAKRIRVQVGVTLLAPTSVPSSFLVAMGLAMSTGVVGYNAQQFSFSTGDTQVFCTPLAAASWPFSQLFAWTVEITLPNEYPAPSAGRSYISTYQLTVTGLDLAGLVTSPTPPTLQVLAWKM